MAGVPPIAINADPEIRIEQITDEHACVIVDDFLKDPRAVVEFAVAHVRDFAIPERSYPGPIYVVNQDAMMDVYRFIRSRMSREFSFLKGGMELSTLLSMATMQPDELSLLQRLCHTDPQRQPSRRNYAALVYLFDNEDLGGTGFYRWKERELIEEATAMELAEPGSALPFLQQHFPTYNRPACYMTESNEIAELLCTIPARFNRLVFYSGDLPHSATISSPELLSEDPRAGRLTLNCFASVRPR